MNNITYLSVKYLFADQIFLMPKNVNLHQMKSFHIYLRRALSLAVMLLLTGFAWSQKTITGTVTDELTDEPLIGASILIKGTSTGTVTDIDGSYTLRANAEDVLVFSYTGYESVEVTVGDQSVVNVAMAAGRNLEEVTVVGYGTFRSREVTSSIATVKSEEFNKGNVTNPANLLQGKVAGLTISQQGGDPNGATQIRLRGTSTLGSNIEPLIIIDGVIGANLQTVDPSDIESMDVLKDASAAAIYGTRAASGVIIITTKKGKAGRTTVNYNVFGTADAVSRTVDVMSAEQYRNYKPPAPLVRSPDLGANTDWFDELTRTGFSHTHNLSLAGGGDKMSYRASFNYRGNQGVGIGSGFDQLNGRLNLNQKALNDKLEMTMNYALTSRNEDLIPAEAFAYAAIFNPTAPVRSEAADFKQYGGFFEETKFDYYNPVSIAEQVDRQRVAKRNLFNITGDYELFSGFKLGAFYSQQRTSDNFGNYIPKTVLWQSNGKGNANMRNDESFNQQLDLTAKYNLDLGGNKILKLLAGYSWQEFINTGFGASGNRFITDEFSFNNLGAAADFADGLGNVFSYKNSNKLIAFFGRASLNVDDTWFVTASLRREGSTKFGVNNKWGFFPGVSAGVDFSRLADIPGFQQLKLRVGYGVTGNTPADSYLSFLTLAPTGSYFFNNGQFVQSIGPTRNPNPNLQWETKSDINIGVDFAAGDLDGTVEFYSTTTSDLILAYNVPVPPNLNNTTFLNVGELKNSGLEFTLSYRGINSNKFSWTPTFTSTLFLENKLISLSTVDLDFGGYQDRTGLGSPGQNGTPTIRLEEGAPLGQILGLKFKGITSEGKIDYEDFDGDGKLDDAKDRQIIGNGLPKFQIGLSNNFRFGNFDATVFLRGVFGHDLINNYRAFYEAPGAASSYNIMATTPEKVGNQTANALFTSLHVEKGDFVRLDNLELGYSVPISKGPFNSARLYVNGRNLFTITNYLGVDPEPRLADIGERGENAAFPDPLAPGHDRRGTYYFVRSFSFGANLNF